MRNVQVPSNRNAISLNIESVLKEQHIIHAAATSSLVRIVMLIDADAHAAKLDGKVDAEEVIAIGKGQSVELAMKRALDNYHNGLKHDDVYSVRHASGRLTRNRKLIESLRGTTQTSSKLDDWLVNGRGELTITKDSDGHILCSLHGHDKTTNSQTTLTGRDKSFSRALAKAFTAERLGFGNEEYVPEQPKMKLERASDAAVSFRTDRISTPKLSSLSPHTAKR